MLDNPINDKEMAKALALLAVTDAAMEEQVMMGLHPPVQRTQMLRIVKAVLDEVGKQNRKLQPPVTRPSITTDQYMTIVNALMTKQKEIEPDPALRFRRNDMMRFATTMLDTQASIAAGGPTTGVPFGPSEFDAQLLAVKEWIGAAVTFMNFAAGQGLIYCPDDRDKPDNDHPAQPDTAMMKLWQAFGEPQAETSDEQVNAHLTGAITDLLGL